jgi:hypothetical protein
MPEVVSLLIILLMLYAFTVVVSWGLMKLILDDEVPAKYALVPVINLLLPFTNPAFGRSGRHDGTAPVLTPEQELTRQEFRQRIPPPGP